MKSGHILGLLALLAAGTSANEPTVWKAGTAKVDITPTEAVRLAGFGFRNKSSEGVRGRIYVRALAMADERGQNAAIVTFDLAMIDRDMAEAVADRCRAQYGLSRDRLLLNVSHTHSGPVIGHMYGPPTEQKRQSTQLAVDQAVAVVGAALRDLKPATLAYGVGVAGIAVNRRRSPTFAGVPGGPVDPDVPVLAVRDANGVLFAVVTGYACHASSLSDYLISNDWPGFALADIDAAHPGAMAFFVQGCGADSNAFPRGTEGLARDHGRVLAAAVEEVLGGKMTPLSGPLASLLDYVEIPFDQPVTRAELQRQATDPDPQVRSRAQQLLDNLGSAERTPASYRYPIEIWRFGRELTLIALGGEVVADYALRLKREFGFEHTWVAGYSNDIMSYIPSRRVLLEGGYEAGLAMPAFGHAGPYAAAVEDIIVEEVKTLNRRVAGSKGVPTP